MSCTHAGVFVSLVSFLFTFSVSEDSSTRIVTLSSSLSTAHSDALRLQTECDMLKLKTLSYSEQIVELRALFQNELEAKKQLEKALKQSKADIATLESNLSKEQDAKGVLNSTVTDLTNQRVTLREQVGILLTQIESNDFNKAKIELERMIRELDGEFEEKDITIKTLKKELIERKASVTPTRTSLEPHALLILAFSHDCFISFSFVLVCSVESVVCVKRMKLCKRVSNHHRNY